MKQRSATILCVRRHFTLLEILVAVGILVIMMLFLFQLTIGAQRLWSASTARTSMAEQANAIFTILEEDMSQMLFSTETDLEMNVHTKPASGSAEFEELAFWTVDAENGRGAPMTVGYFVENVTLENGATTKNLYRIQNVAPFDKIGIPSPAGFADFGLAAPANADAKENFLLATNITSMNVLINRDAATNKPRLVKVKVTLAPPEELQSRESVGDTEDAKAVAKAESRTFSKVYFLK